MSHGAARTRKNAAPLVALAAAAAFGAACGPSYQAVHEGDARFEHCYALDEGASTSVNEKSHCWSDYREHYAFGQSRDRLTYAARREHLLTREQALPTDEAMMEAAPGQVAIQPNAPAPTNAFVPPPQLLTAPSSTPTAQQQPAPFPLTAPSAPVSSDARTGAVAATSFGPAIEAPGAPCANRCNESWNACEKGCAAKGQQKAACEKCDHTHKSCMAACFR